MTEAQFTEWLDFYGALQPNFAEWIGKQHDFLIREWVEGVADAPFEAAKEWAKRVCRGDEKRPFRHEHTLGALNAYCRQAVVDASPRYRPIDGGDTFNCATCQDFGLVYVFTATTMRNLREWLDDGKKPDDFVTQARRYNVPCSCPRGKQRQAYYQRNDSSYDLEFDPCRMVAAGGITADAAFERLVEWVRGAQPAGHVEAFAAFNAGGEM